MVGGSLASKQSVEIMFDIFLIAEAPILTDCHWRSYFGRVSSGHFVVHNSAPGGKWEGFGVGF